MQISIGPLETQPKIKRRLRPRVSSSKLRVDRATQKNELLTNHIKGNPLYKCNSWEQ